MNDRTALLDEIDAGWRAFAAALANLSDDDLLGLADGTWTRKDLVAHVAWWEGSSADALVAVAAGREPEWLEEPLDERNARVEAEHKDLTPAVVRQMALETHARLIRAIEDADELDLFDADRLPWLQGDPLASKIRGDTSEHYPDHLAALRSGR